MQNSIDNHLFEKRFIYKGLEDQSSHPNPKPVSEKSPSPEELTKRSQEQFNRLQSERTAQKPVEKPEPKPRDIGDVARQTINDEAEYEKKSGKKMGALARFIAFLRNTRK